MKVSTICLFSCSISLHGQAAAFAPQSPNRSSLPSRHHSITSTCSSSSLNAVENAVSSAPDILLAAGAALTTVGAAAAAALGKIPSFGGSTDQSSAVNGNAIGTEAVPEIIDVTIPYDAASRLAFESYPENDSVKYAQFKMLYESQMVAEVKAKVQERKVKEMQLVLDELEKDAAQIRVQIDELFRPKTTVNEEKVMKESVSGTSVDLSIDYDAAAKLAYEASGKSIEFDTFREKYVEETVAMVSAKKAKRDASN